MTEPVLYSERGSNWWPVMWGPVFALLGFGVEALTPGPVNAAMWLLVGGVLAASAAIWVYGRRRLVSVRLTPAELVQGREELEVSRIKAVTDVGAPVGARVLGGSWTVPKGTGEVPIRLDDDKVALAWAKDPEALAKALARLVEE
jgi:membrane protein implicated in regulation of membrane protease activity